MSVIIEQAARKFSDDGYPDDIKTAIEQAFIAGAMFAQKWIPTYEETPDGAYTVLVKNSDGVVHTGYYSSEEKKWMVDVRYNYIVTHWRQI